MLHKQRKN